MSTLDQSLRDLCAKYSALNIGVTYHGGDHFSVSIQWEDASAESGRLCSLENGRTSAEALAKAVHDMAFQRAQGISAAIDGELA